MSRVEWLRDFVSLSENTEVPDMFALWTGMSGLSLCLGRRCWLDMGTYKIYPNMFIVLVAGSGRCRKSTSIGILESLIYNLDPRPNIISQKITPEAFIEAMKDGPTDPRRVLVETCEGFVVVDELSNFLNKKTYEAGLASLLISLYDCKPLFEYRTKIRGVEKIENACLGMLGGSTIEWIQDAIPIGAVGGGLTSRMIFIYEKTPKPPVAWTQNRHDHHEVCKRLIEGLQRVWRLSGPMTLTPEAKDYYCEVYDHFYKGSVFFENKFLSGYASRRHVHMLKLGMVFSAAEGDTLIVDKGHLFAAVGLLEATEQNMEEVLSLITASGTGTTVQVVETKIRKLKRISRASLIKSFSHQMSAKEMDEIIRTLVHSGAIREFADGNTIFYGAI